MDADPLRRLVAAWLDRDIACFIRVKFKRPQLQLLPTDGVCMDVGTYAIQEGKMELLLASVHVFNEDILFIQDRNVGTYLSWLAAFTNKCQVIG